LAREDGLISTKNGKLTKKVMEAIHYNGNNLKDIVDWPHSSPELKKGETDNYEFTDYNTVVNAFHYRGLVLMHKIALALGKQKDADFYQKKADKIYTSFNNNFYDSSRGIYTDGIGANHASIHANMFPLAFSLVPEAHKESVINYIKVKGWPVGFMGLIIFWKPFIMKGKVTML
jgi:alpha-L-rhamnosidase